MITIKLPYKTDNESLEVIKELTKQQNLVTRSSYKRFYEDKKQIDVRKYVSNLNGINKLDSWFIQCGVLEGKSSGPSAM